MPETSTIPSAGLFVRDDSHALIPLSGVSIHAEISGLCARVVVAHRYVNRETTPIEAVYVFPLDEGAAVCGFEAVIDGTLVIGEVQEREQAFETYDAAMEHGHGAFLLDEERPDVFQASVGNLPPGKEVLVRLTYVVELSIDGGRLRFTIPTTVSPRYAPKEDQTGTGRPDSETLNPPVAWTVPYGLSLSVHLSMPGRIAALESPSHPIAVALNEGEATVTFAQGERALDRDFVLSIDAAGLDAPQAWIERDDEGQEAVAVAFVPAFANASCPADIVFVVDRSGSMQGTSIEEVRNALQLCLRSMIPGCRFNIIGFGSTHHALFPESRAYDQASLEAASSHVAGLQADLGGTEILPALDFALRQPRHPELVRQLVVLTDGEVTNTDAVLALATRHAADVRIFTFGIGAGASHHLVRGLARIGGGSAEFIYPGERVEPKVLRQFARLLSPALGDAAVDWMGGDVTQAPTKVPPVFAGNRLLVYGLVKATPAAVRLTATGPSGSISLEVPLDTAPHVRGKTVATLAARARIRELEEGSEWLGTRGSRQKDRKQQSVTKEIVELSIRYGLISRETSYVAVERRDTPVHGDIQLRRVPIALTSGWGGLERWLPVLHASRHAKMAGWFDLHRGVFSRTDAPQGAPMLAHQALEAPLGKLDFHVDHLRVPRLPMRPSGLDALIALQAADGSWDLTAELARIIGRRLSELEAAVDGASGASPSIRRAWATALALAWLQLHAGGLQEEWRLLAAKARNWIEGAGAVAPGGSHWIDAATRFLSP